MGIRAIETRHARPSGNESAADQHDRASSRTHGASQADAGAHSADHGGSRLCGERSPPGRLSGKWPGGLAELGISQGTDGGGGRPPPGRSPSPANTSGPPRSLFSTATRWLCASARWRKARSRPSTRLSTCACRCSRAGSDWPIWPLPKKRSSISSSTCCASVTIRRTGLPIIRSGSPSGWTRCARRAMRRAHPSSSRRTPTPSLFPSSTKTAVRSQAWVSPISPRPSARKKEACERYVPVLQSAASEILLDLKRLQGNALQPPSAVRPERVPV